MNNLMPKLKHTDGTFVKTYGKHAGLRTYIDKLIDELRLTMVVAPEKMPDRDAIQTELDAASKALWGLSVWARMHIKHQLSESHQELVRAEAYQELTLTDAFQMYRQSPAYKEYELAIEQQELDRPAAQQKLERSIAFKTLEGSEVYRKFKLAEKAADKVPDPLPDLLAAIDTPYSKKTFGTHPEKTALKLQLRNLVAAYPKAFGPREKRELITDFIKEKTGINASTAYILDTLNKN